VSVASRDQPEIVKREVSPHTLRHTKAMSLLNSGADLVTIQTWLGHARVDTTHHYLQASVEMKRRALEKRTSPGMARPGRYQPPDDLLAFLENLSIM
jgi:integrase/recombinase XerD